MKSKSAWVLVLVPVIFLWSCGTIGSLGKKEEPQVYYAAEQDLKLYPEPSLSATPIAELSLNEKVLRYRSENAFGYVKVERTGQMGWVENARLKWRIEKQEITPETAAPQQIEEEPSDQSSPPSQQDKKKAVDIFSPGKAEAATPPAASDPEKSKKKPDASILDSY